MTKTLMAAMVLAWSFVFSIGGLAQTPQDRTQDKVAFPAHKIIGNVYYVGTAMLNSYLITTPQGHMLINTNFEDTVPLLRASVEKLGFVLTDIKIILGSHAHGDHMQADAVVKELTGGATVMVMDQDVPALKAMKAPSGKPHPIDRVLKDGEQVSLGGATLTAHLTPGHTRGCTTWSVRVADGGRRYDVLIVCAGLQEGAQLVNNKNYPEIADDFARSFKKYRTLPADVFLGAHSWFFDLAGKYKKLGGPTNPYVDPGGYKAWLDNQEKNYNTLLAEQKKNPPAD
ncbi:MAG TPA: subclass B3 metallo-beta-lactamase [Vicinamibacterales bacterium]|jgi:metallo-beta-lactamase class B